MKICENHINGGFSIAILDYQGVMLLIKMLCSLCVCRYDMITYLGRVVQVWDRTHTVRCGK